MRSIVILRRFDKDTYVSTVILEPDNKDGIDDMDDYLNSKADTYIRNFCDKFKEFKPIMFTKSLCDTE
jgi:hypothetical protein